MLTWQLKPFNGLTNAELYAILRLRQEVFVLEQNCPFIDADNYDQPSYHLCGYLNGLLAAYARLVPPGVIYPEYSIGRIITPLSHRRLGYGRLLMEKAIDEAERLFGREPIKIMAQQYLQRFYEAYGFVRTTEPFLEDGIPHIMMVRG